MKRIITSIKEAFTTTRSTYNATLLIAGQQITTKIIAKNPEAAARQAEIIVDDCGFVLDITAC